MPHLYNFRVETRARASRRSGTEARERKREYNEREHDDEASINVGDEEDEQVRIDWNERGQKKDQENARAQPLVKRSLVSFGGFAMPGPAHTLSSF